MILFVNLAIMAAVIRRPLVTQSRARIAHHVQNSHAFSHRAISHTTPSVSVKQGRFSMRSLKSAGLVTRVMWATASRDPALGYRTLSVENVPMGLIPIEGRV